MKKQKVIAEVVVLCALVVLSLPTGVYAFPDTNVPVILYHKVDDPALTTYWVSLHNFRDQMFLLYDLGYTSVDLDDVYNHVKGIAQLPAKPVVIRFDDAYANAYEHAMPLLAERGFFGLSNCGPTDFIGDSEPNRMDNAWDRPPEPVCTQLIWPEVNELYNAGWAIEAHSKTHKQISQMVLADEVASRHTIASKAGIPTPHFYAYPFGQYNDTLIGLLKADGYLGAMDASGGIEKTSRLKADPNQLFHIRCNSVNRDDTLSQFATKIGATVPSLPTLTVNVVGDGSVQTNPDQPYYHYDTVVTLTAIPGPFWNFSGWSGNLSGPNNPETITMDTSKTVTATFVFEGQELLNDGFEGAVWDANWNDIAHSWYRDNSPIHSGSYSASARNNNEGVFTSDNLNTSDAAAVYVDFWFQKDDIESTEFTLYYYDGNNYNLIVELDTLGSDDVWLHYTDTITDSNYFISNFRIRFDGYNLDTYENVWVDDVIIKKAIPQLTAIISGTILDPNAAPVAGVSVDANNSGGSDITDVNGYYELEVTSSWSGTVTPTKTDYTFAPPYRAYANVTTDQTNQNYTATSIYDLYPDGVIDWLDLDVLCDNWLTAGPAGDFNSDGIVDLVDYAKFASAW